MNRMQVICGYCGGFGKTKTWVEVSENEFKAKEITCQQCDGKGHTEHAVFSIEEAEAILKHCGLYKE